MDAAAGYVLDQVFRVDLTPKIIFYSLDYGRTKTSSTRTKLYLVCFIQTETDPVSQGSPFLRLHFPIHHSGHAE